VPQEFELVTEILPDVVRRTLTLLGKVLQSLSNQVEFGEKELFMVPLNPFVLQTIPRMKRFLKTISRVTTSQELILNAVEMLTSPVCGLWEEEAFVSSLHVMRRFLISDRVQFLLSRYQAALDEELLAILHNFPAELTDSQKIKARKKKEKKNKKKRKDSESTKTSKATKLSKSVSQRKLKEERRLSALSSQALEKRRMSSSGMLGGLLGGYGVTSPQRKGEGEDMMHGNDTDVSSAQLDVMARAYPYHGGTPGRRQMNKLLTSSKKLIQLPRSDSRPFLRAKRKNSCTQLPNGTTNSDS